LHALGFLGETFGFRAHGNKCTSFFAFTGPLSRATRFTLYSSARDLNPERLLATLSNSPKFFHDHVRS
jgi:hypothetical protein